MSLQDRIAQLEQRERQLLGVFLAVFCAMVFLLVPIGISVMLMNEGSENEKIRRALGAIAANRGRFSEVEAANRAVLNRYRQPPPPLAGLLSRLASSQGIDIPQSQDVPAVPLGKKFEEQATKITLTKVGMYNFAHFMDSLAHSEYPVSVTRVALRKRATEPDSYDVEMTVSAYHRKGGIEAASEHSHKSDEEREE